jgi:flagellar basal-body rod protein FlgF
MLDQRLVEAAALVDARAFLTAPAAQIAAPGGVEAGAITGVTIGSDGTVTAQVGITPPTNVGRIKLVNPPAAELRKGPDGLMRTAEGDPAPADAAVRVADGVVEGSNVNPIESMIGLIASARQFEMQMKMLQTAESNEQRASRLLAPNG